MYESDGHQLSSSGKWEEEGSALFISVTFYFLNISKKNKQRKKRLPGRGEKS